MFKYGIAAGVATVVDVLVYTLVKNYVLYDTYLTVAGLTASPMTSSLIISFSCGLITNFTITKYYVFKESTLRTRTQFVRFTAIAILVFFGNKVVMQGLYKLLPTMVELSPKVLAFSVRGISAVGVGVLSFISHKLFSFR